MHFFQTIVFALALHCAISFLYAQDYNYAEVLQKSMWFYEAQRSGELPENNRVEWRGNSAVQDGSDVGHDLSGGWYDAGDNMKFNFPMASSVTLLAWGGLEYPEGYRKYGQWGWLLNNLKWVTDYFVKCHTAPNEFYGQIGMGMLDHKWWGAPEVFPNARPSFKIDAQHPGSELAAEAAAALASSSILFRGTDPAYADNILSHAKELFEFADTYRGNYHKSITDVTDFYKSWNGYFDELTWGALWLYCATGEQRYLSKAEALYKDLPKEPNSDTPIYKEALSWDEKSFGCYVLLAKITNKPQYHTDAQRWLDWWTHGYSVRNSQQGGGKWSSEEGVAYTPAGLAWIRQWGPIRYAVNTAFAAFVYSDCGALPPNKKTLYYNWAKSQIDYALGNNEQKRSYVCGFGANPPVKPHHRSMHGPYLDDNGRTPADSRHILYGALVGGPGPDGAFKDNRLDAVRNEVATDYNSGFSSALARLARDNNCKALENFPSPAQRDTEYVVVAKVNTGGDRFTEISATIQNRTTWPARYSKNLTIRYFVDLSEVIAAGFSPSDVRVEYKGCGLCSKGDLAVSALKPYSTGSLYYTEISFNGESIFPGGQSAYRREVQFRMGLPESAPRTTWDPSNDPSFKGLSSMANNPGTPSVPAYENGVLVWGEEPNGNRFVPSTWNMPVFSEPPFKPSGWNASLFKEASAINTPRLGTTQGIAAIERKNGAVVINAMQNVAVKFFSLNGKRLYAERIGKGSCKIFHLSNIPASAFYLSINSRSYLPVMEQPVSPE